MIAKIDHVVIFVTNMDKAIDFYTIKLGLQLKSKSEHWSQVGGDENGVFLGLHLTKKRDRDLIDTTDVVFRVKDINVARKELEDKGIEFYDAIKEVGPNLWFTSFYDPDGNNFSIFQGN